MPQPQRARRALCRGELACGSAPHGPSYQSLTHGCWRAGIFFAPILSQVMVRAVKAWWMEQVFSNFWNARSEHLPMDLLHIISEEGSDEEYEVTGKINGRHGYSGRSWHRMWG